MSKITVIGDGGWGTCLAVHLANRGHEVILWGAFPQYIAEMQRKRENPKFLPGVPFPNALVLTGRIDQAFEKAELVVIAVPSQYLKRVFQQHIPSAPWNRVITVSVVKGIEADSLQRMSQVIRSLAPVKQLAVLSGPSISYEVARGVPTTVVAAADDEALARQVQGLFATERFRVYTSTDLIGVELGGSLKNVIAIACGAADGLGFGTNTKAALTTRGLAEISRLGVAMGAKTETFYGLSGLGDLVTTCFSAHSRNRQVGEKLGKGTALIEITAGMEQVAEGMPTAKSAHALAKKYNVDMPITAEVYRILYEGKLPNDAVRDLMLREPKAE
jgi:glycerol-3-phosphate dehydrogenase (NAD(P)+)